MILGSGGFRGEGNGCPLQYSRLETPMDRRPGGLQPMGSLRVGHDWAALLLQRISIYFHWFLYFVDFCFLLLSFFLLILGLICPFSGFLQ